MTRQYLFAGILLLSFASGAAWAAVPGDSSSAGPDRATKIESVKQQFLATGDADQRKHLLRELRAAGRAPADAAALNAAVYAMLPASRSVSQAEELLAIAATANPAPNTAAELSSSSQKSPESEFLVNERAAADAALQPQGEVEELADIRIDRLRKDSLGHDGLADSHVQQLWRINTAQGARTFASRNLMYSAMGERLCVLRARVLQRSGGELQAAVSGDQPVLDRSSSMYFDSRTRNLRFPHLQPGDLVEIEYLVLPASEVSPWSGYYARLDLFSDSFSTRLRRRVLIAPSSLKLYAVEHGVNPVIERNQGDETVRIWEMRDVAPAVAEAMSPGASSIGPYLHVSTIGDMQQFGAWYSGLLRPALKLDDDLQAIALEIASRNSSTPAKVQAVYEAVQRRTRYVAFEFGVYSYQPYPLADVDRRGFGDCKDKAAMIVALLRAVGVDADFAMVRTRSTGEIASEAYSVQLFNHALAYVPELDLFLDGTVEYAAPGELPPDDQGAMAITVDASGNAMRRIVPFTSGEANSVSRHVQARLRPDGHVEFVSQTRYSGYFAAVERRSTQSTDDLAGSSQAALARFYPTVKVAHAVAEGTARASREVELKVDGELDAALDAAEWARQAGNHEISLRTSLLTAAYAIRYASRAERRNPLLVPVTPGEREIFEYELPAGATALLPEDTILRTPFGRVEVSYQITGSNLRVETIAELNPQTVSAGDYPAFRTFCKSIDEALQRGVKIVLP
jgi:cellulose synthase operon protein C